jgi:biotin carboxylase
MSRRILVMSAGTGPSNNLMRSLKSADDSVVLFGCHVDRFVLNLSPAMRNFLLPPFDPADAESGARLDEALRAIVALGQVDVIIPGNDHDSLSLATMQERQPFACHTLLPSVATIDLCQDKYVLNQMLASNGIPVARTYSVTSKRDLLKAWRALAPCELAWCRIRRGAASRGATMVRDASQAWSWICYWHTMRGVDVSDFTLSAFLPGRDYNVQGLWSDGHLVLIKMCERLSYLNADHHPSGMASTPALAKSTWESAAIQVCEAALQLIDPHACGVFNFDLKENEAGEPCITEINAGRFAMITNLYDLTGRHNMVGTYVRMACGEAPAIDDPYDENSGHYLIRELDTLPVIVASDQLFTRVEKV